MALVVPLMAGAQQRADVPFKQGPVQLAISSTVTGTSNGEQASSGLEQRDLFLTVRPSATLAYAGAGLNLGGELGADLLWSKNKTRENQALPFARVNGAATLIDRFFYFNASLDVHQVEQDKFAGRVDQGLGANTDTSSTLVLSPSLMRELTDDVSFAARADLVWAKFADNAMLDSRDDRYSLKLDARPRPWGGAIELRGQDVRYDGATSNDWSFEAASVAPRYSINSEVVVGLVGGVERTSTAGQTATDPLYGVNLLWVPSQRSQLAASVDRRFFGAGWNLAVRHRAPTYSLSVRASRQPVLAGNDGVGSRSSLPAFLDSILTTRYPDPNERAGIVSSLVATRGLQTTIQGAAGPSANYAQLGQGADATVVFLGTRNTVSLSLFHTSLTQLARADTGAQFPGSGQNDDRQWGATVGLNRRLTPVASADLALNFSRIEGLNARIGDLTREGSVRLAYVQQIAPRTAASLGTTYHKVSTNVIGLASYDEATLFAGLAHRF
jgi:uncharacterized protein (PEP-CTERM system associated)